MTKRSDFSVEKKTPVESHGNCSLVLPCFSEPFLKAVDANFFQTNKEERER